jgi:glutamate dehydrogenase
LLRLFYEAKPISEFTKSKLSSHGRKITVNEGDGAGTKARNRMTFTVKSDVFIPAGGRPFTINDTNWRSFLLADGTPSSRLIVEGANIFVRTFETLFNAGEHGSAEKAVGAWRHHH